jgi:hypothetical protein
MFWLPLTTRRSWKRQCSPLVCKHLTTGGIWYNVYTTEYTTNHNPLVVYRHHATGGLWYNVYTTEYTTNHNPLVV